MLRMADGWTILKTAALQWVDDRAPELGAALAFYSMLSIGPLLLIATGIAGLVFGQEAASGQIVAQMQGLVGKQGAEAVQALIANAERFDSGLLATLLGIATLLFGACGVFGQLQQAMNIIWKVEPKPGQGLWRIVKDRFLSFSIVLGTGFLLLVSLIVSAALAAISKYFEDVLPGAAPLLEIVNGGVALGVSTLLFAMIFKILPDAPIRWRDVWGGAAVTALLFNLGKLLIGLYLGRSATASAYGAAGSLIVLLLWVYYSSQILFFGAELTQAYSRLTARKQEI